MSTGDWTVDPATGARNSSPEFRGLRAEVERLIRGDTHKLIGGRADQTASLVMGQLAHKHDVGPLAAARREGWAQAIEALRAEAERRDKSGLYGDGGFGIAEAADYLTDRAAALTEEPTPERDPAVSQPGTEPEQIIARLEAEGANLQQLCSD